MAQALTHEGWPWARMPVPDPARQHPLARLPGLLTEALHLPFDLLRSQHALAVRAGLISRSLLESRDFEQSVVALEQAALGPLARQL